MRLISYRQPAGAEALGVAAGDRWMAGGVGIFRMPPLPLGDGDEVSVEIEGIRRLVNTCRRESMGVPA